MEYMIGVVLSAHPLHLRQELGLVRGEWLQPNDRSPKTFVVYASASLVL